MLRRVTVMEWERVVRYSRGRLVGVLEPGRYWLRRASRTYRVDLRPRTVTLPGQEVLTSDAVGVRASLVLTVRVADPVAYVTSAVSADESLYVGVQLALRSAVGSVDAESLLASRAAVDEAIALAAAEAAAGWGLVVENAGIRDLSFPGELRKVFAETAAAKQEARAAVERARGETAALRALANAARAVEEHPGLLRLRTLQAVEASSGATVVLTER